VKFDILETAADIVSRSGRDQPADQVLRETFKRLRDVPSFDAAEISGLVFAFFRWQGWLESEAGIERKLRKVRELVLRFQQGPASFPVEELQSKSVPSWAPQEVPAAPEWYVALQREPRLWLRARRGQGATLARQLGDTRPAGGGLLSDTLEYLGHEDLFRRPEFHAGVFELQDISSQAVGWVCQPQPGETWWDACAGGGGKLLHLSDQMQNKGLIWASDRAAWRLKKLKRRTARAGVFNYRSELWDGSSRLPTRTRFNGVLVDAPCSGVGTWQRNPHARWTTTLEDVHELAVIQKNLVRHAAVSLKPGGRLIYAVCTLTRSETIDVADAFDAEMKDFKPMPCANPLAPDQTPTPRLWLWPQDHGGNGMFIAAWERIE
jgi:16S rRNA (cytosine967-C5)-methyltransferase